MKKLILLTFLIYFFNSIAVSGQQLQGKISLEVGKRIKPLDPLLWTGNYFDEKAATALLKDESVNSNIWKKIPAWQAGEWEITQATNTKTIEYLEGKPHTNTAHGVYTDNGRMTIGCQTDKNGDIWHWCGSGYWTETELDGYIDHTFVTFAAPGNADYSDYYAESIDFYVDKSTNKITSVMRRKAWDRLTYLKPDLFKEESVHTMYDEKGIPILSAWNTALNKRTLTFANLKPQIPDVDERRRDFYNYLKNSGLANLIPADSNTGNKEATRNITRAH